MNKNIGIVLGIIVIAGIGFFAFSGDKAEKKAEKNEVVQNNNEAVMMNKDDEVMSDKGT